MPSTAILFRHLSPEIKSSEGRATRSNFCSQFCSLTSDHHTTTTGGLVSTLAFISDHSRPPTRLW
ncbi:hypothetical protein PanWU01x14_273360 [Parasponia andersonii]|uniref:Uncharacterized protein n=1 Tax=Parasponia andersonii TaxID=3476 RepID=A0A2P5B3V4_PARAD|nr:hypothetical protein PanWU01x14_273360 [Parasponia andersonii]